jgi:hypothetical protein
MTRTYSAHVTREGKWWMVAIPEIDGLTQARRLSEADEMARDYIAVTLDMPVADVKVRMTIADIADIHVRETLTDIRNTREEAEALEAEARIRTEMLAKRLARAEVPVRDIGTLMGISFQRAHQLVTADR